jgi:hypothetical protein
MLYRAASRTLALSVIALAFSCPVRAGTLVDRLTALVDRTTYQLDIQERWETAPLPLPPVPLPYKAKQPGQIPIRVLSIHCIDKCKSAVSYQEEVDDSPIAAFRLWDGSRDLITIWAGGSAYRVRIYHVGEQGIEKVMEESTREAPQFGIAADNSLIVILHNPDFPVPAGSFHVNGGIWTWDGRRYRPATGETRGD